MSGALPWVLLLALLAHAAAHVAISVGIARRGPPWRGAVALVVPPLAPLWGWRSGLRLAVYAWATSLAVYALGVALA